MTTKKKKTKPKARTEWETPAAVETVAANWQQQCANGRWRPVSKSQIGTNRRYHSDTPSFRRPVQAPTKPLTKPPTPPPRTHPTGDWVTPSHGEHVSLSWEFRRNSQDTWKPAIQSYLIGMQIGPPNSWCQYEFRKPVPPTPPPIGNPLAWKRLNGDLIPISTMSLTHIGNAVRCCLNQQPDYPPTPARMRSLVGLIFEYARRRGTEPEAVRALITGSQLTSGGKF
jgi:hypothetical protein